MTNTKSGSQTLKTDVLGRVKTSAARRQELLDEFERSGTSGARFAEWAGIKYSSIASWVQKRRRNEVAPLPLTADPHICPLTMLDSVGRRSQLSH